MTTQQPEGDGIRPLPAHRQPELAEAARRAERQAERRASQLPASAVYRRDLATVEQAVSDARKGAVLGDSEHAELARALTDIRVRDVAWARMDPGYAEQHQALWTGTARRAQPGYVAAPASLLAITAAQRGDRGLASAAVDRALEDDPRYSLARLLGQVVDIGMPPSSLAPPMTPDEVDEAYGHPGRDRGAEATTERDAEAQ